MKKVKEKINNKNNSINYKLKNNINQQILKVKIDKTVKEIQVKTMII